MLLQRETVAVVSDKEKRRQRPLKVCSAEPNASEPTKKPRKQGDAESKGLRLSLRQSATGNLIMGCMASGVKLAGLHSGLFYGTSEIAIAL